MVIIVKLIEEKFKSLGSNGANAIAIGMDEEKIKKYIVEHAMLKRTAITQMGDCDDCGYSISHLYEVKSIDNDVTEQHVLSNDWTTVIVDGDQYAVRKDFYEIIYNSDLELITKEIEDNYDDFTGLSVVVCPKCQKWSVGD